MANNSITSTFTNLFDDEWKYELIVHDCQKCVGYILHTSTSFRHVIAP